MKVLIISHNPVSSQSSMGKTFLSLFSEFESTELCQLYIYPTVPSEACCGSYYRVTDKEAVKAVLTRSRIGGQIPPEQITRSQGAYENAADESLYRNRKNKSALRRLLRDGAWKLTPWYNQNLKQWLDREAPDCIFVAPGVAKFVYDFALRISRERQLPMAVYVCDEYYFVKQPEQLLDRLRLKLLKDRIDTLMARSEELIVISRELEELYAEHFSIPTSVLMTGAAFPIPEHGSPTEDPQAICYFGNVRSNRYLSLCQIGQCLDEINRQRGSSYKLKIYTSEKDPQILTALKNRKAIELCGFLTGGEFARTLRQSDILLHVEAFDEESIDRVRRSVSTKIADSLASGVPLLAYGPAEVSSMKHLMRHDCAITATDPTQLYQALLTAFTDRDSRCRTVEHALATAREYHDSRLTSRRLRKILETLATGK